MLAFYSGTLKLQSIRTTSHVVLDSSVKIKSELKETLGAQTFHVILSGLSEAGGAASNPTP